MSALIIAGAITSFDNCAWGQIASDNTLGSENSQVTSLTPGNFQIDGGVTRETNLFHSFSQFSVPTNGTAYFNNAANIQNIISRVTGGTISDINGLIKANGTANLFLLNPNGIIFGPSASLNIGGSFLGSTASSLNFADGTHFSAINPQSTPLLTLSVPIGLQYGKTAGSIVNQSRVTNIIGQRVGLQVLPGKTLALLGGDVELDGGNLLAPGGRVELGGVIEPGTVELNSDSSLSFPVGVQLSDISLTNRAVVNVSAINSGSIALTARNLEILGASTLLANREPGLGVNNQVGDITLNATEAITVANDSDIVSDVQLGAVGNGGSINITSGSLSVADGAHLAASTRGKGDGGSVTIIARDTVSFDGVSSSNRQSGAFSGVDKGIGNGGSINITSGSLSVADGAQLAASTSGQGDAGRISILARDQVKFDGEGSNGGSSGAFSRVNSIGVGKGGNIDIIAGSLYLTNAAFLVTSTLGRGNGGSVTISARDTVLFEGVTSNGFPGGTLSRVLQRAEGNAGNINITTGSLFVKNGAVLNTSTLGQGNAGRITITARDTVSFDGNNNRNSSTALSTVGPRAIGNGGDINIMTRSLLATNGGRLNADTEGQGDAGNITINARDKVVLDGVGSNGNLSGIFGAVSVPANITINQDLQYQGGNLTIKTEQLIVKNNAEVNVRSTSLGSAGDIRVEADSLELNNRGKIKAEATRSQGGNINLQVRDLILMRRQGLISATAGGSGNGGNVTIGNATNAPLILAFPTEDSDIIAQASDGQGGKIDIFTQGIFGIEKREAIAGNGTNDIDASSQSGVNGIVEVNTPDVDPSQGLVDLPDVPVNVEVAEGCQTGGKQASLEFFNTGRGGIAPNPYEPLSSSNLWEDVPLPTNASVATPHDQIVEAQGWIFDDNGAVTLVAAMPSSGSQASCSWRAQN